MIGIIQNMDTTNKAKPNGRGGAGRGQGRKAQTLLGSGEIVKKTITVDLETSEVLTIYGEGNLSEGIRRAAKLVKGQGQ